jgi:hypothetical protein
MKLESFTDTSELQNSWHADHRSFDCYTGQPRDKCLTALLDHFSMKSGLSWSVILSGVRRKMCFAGVPP